jgi:arylamine N-acetyltransferase
MKAQQTNPLENPVDKRLLKEFLSHWQLNHQTDPKNCLAAISRAFSRLPYENLTKIIKEAALGKQQSTRRLPDEVLSDHYRLGTGGTCFSLTAALLHLVRSLGFYAQPLLADRNYGANTHCALVVWIEEVPHLIDPGYLIVDPVPLPQLAQEPVQIKNRFNTLELESEQEGSRLALYSLNNQQKKRRLTFKTDPAEPQAFLKAWDDSFAFEMMRYPVITRVDGQSQLYFQKNRFQIRQADQVTRSKLQPNDILDTITQEFAIDPSVVKRALKILHERGEHLG